MDKAESFFDSPQKHISESTGLDEANRSDSSPAEPYQGIKDPDDFMEYIREKWRTIIEWFDPNRTVATFTVVIALTGIVYTFFAWGQWNGLLEANKISHAALVATQRAYVTINGLQIEPVKDGNDKQVFWRLAPKIVNSGNTPTKNMWYTATFGDYEVNPQTENPPSIPQTEDLINAAQNRGTLGARQETDILMQQPIPVQYATEVMNRRMRIRIRGAIVYEDFFTTETHVTRYCYALWGNPAITGTYGLSYSMCGGSSNCADQECDAATQEQLKKLRAKKPN